jgi:outer membrane protein, multidrug efflux system
MAALLMKSSAALVAVAALLAGCATPADLPHYKPELAAGFAAAPATTEEPVAEFWQRFGDSELDALVAAAIERNADLRIAVANLKSSRALAGFADAQARPTIGASLGATRIREPDGEGGSTTFNAFTAGFDASWEIDLFGRISNNRIAAAADARASEALLRATQVSVAAEVARNYFELRGLQEQLRVATVALQTQQEALKLVDARLQVGRGTALDTERARALTQTTAATVPAFEAAAARARYRIAVLTGRTPTALDAQLAQAKPIPGLAPTALDRVGSPEAMLRRRPDVQAAEAQLDAAAARVGLAQAQRFPQVTLAGSIGQNASRVGDFGNSAAFVYQLGASLVWSLLDFGRNTALIASAGAQGEAAAASYEKAVLAALEDTEGALTAYTRTQQQTQALFDAAQSATKASEIARARFAAGTSDFLAVLDAEREVLSARDSLAQAQTASATSLVAVYKALAGGWEQAPP